MSNQNCIFNEYKRKKLLCKNLSHCYFDLYIYSITSARCQCKKKKVKMSITILAITETFIYNP